EGGRSPLMRPPGIGLLRRLSAANNKPPAIQSDLKARAGVIRIGAVGTMATLNTSMDAAMKANKVSASEAVADDPRSARIMARDKGADGAFWYSVLTTGVYCRPSCPSRPASAKNVRIHATLAEAKATGFRPCKRCNPDGRSADDVAAGLV